MEHRAASAPAQQPALPSPYVIALLLEATGLVSLLAASPPGHPRWSYELGWAGAGSMFLMQAYSLRRRVRALRALGPLRAWLDAHVFLGLQGFLLVAYHSVDLALHPTLAALNFAVVSVIVATGLAGRYCYGRVWAARAATTRALAALDPLAPAPADTSPRRWRGLAGLGRLHLPRRWRTEPERQRAPSSSRALATRHAVGLELRRSRLEIAERWLARWTLLHRPLAVLLLALTLLHVLAHFAYAT